MFGGSRFALGRGVAIAVAGGGRARAQRHLQPGGAGGGRTLRAHRLSHDAGRPAAQGRGRAQFLCARRTNQRASRGGRDRGARLHPRRLCQAPALGRRQDRQPLRRDLRGRRSVPGTGDRARPRSAARRPHPRLWRRLRRLCPRRARLQDRDDLHPAGIRHLGQMGLGERPGAAPPAPATTCGNCSRSCRRSVCWSRTATATWSRPMR